MSATLSIVNSFYLEVGNGVYTGHQGEIESLITDALPITVTGKVHALVSTLATAAVAAVFADEISGFAYLFFWSDQASYIQLLSAATNVSFKIAAYQPFVLPGFDDLLAAANTTPISGGTEPTLARITGVNIGNYSGTTMNYVFAVVS